MKALFPLMAAIITATAGYGAPSKTVYTIGGTFSNSAHWSLTSGGVSCTCTPDISKDSVYIETNMTHTGDLEFGSQVVVFIAENSSFVVTGDVEFKNGSQVDIADGSRFDVYGDVVNDNESDEINVDGGFNVYQNNGVGGSYTGQRGSQITGGGTLVTIGNMITLDVGGPGNPGLIFGSPDDCTTGFCSASQAGGVVLPVELESFSEDVAKNGTLLSWSTATESNNDYFTLEGSVDGIDFEWIGQIQGMGTTSMSTDYSYTDQNDFTYYRLSQTDFDGSLKVLKVVSVATSSSDISFNNSPCRVECLVTINKLTSVQLVDLSGAILVNAQLKGTVDLSQWIPATGIYFLSAGGKAEHVVYLSE